MTTLFQRCWLAFDGLPFIRNGIQQAQSRYEDVYEATCEHHLRVLLEALDGDFQRFDAAVESFVTLTIDSLKMQAQFVASGKFAAFSPDQAAEHVYNDADLMQGPYLSGLYLAHVFWPNHFQKLQYFRDSFLQRLPETGTVLDVGSGPGTFAVNCSLARPDVQVLALDISPFSPPMVLALHRASGGETGRLRADAGDFLEAKLEAQAPLSGVIFSEVVEHLSDPAKGMEKLARLVRPETPIFFTTATNAAFYDHTIIFADQAEIEALLARFGFVVDEYLAIPVYQSRQALPVLDYNAIIHLEGTG